MRNRYIIASALLCGLRLSSGQVFADRHGDDENDCKSGRHNLRSVHSSKSNDRDEHACNGNTASSPGTSSSSAQTRTKLKEYLASAVQPEAYGMIELETKTNSTTFESEVKIQVPSPVIGITDSAAAQSASVSLSLLRGSVEYASCDFDLKKAYTTRAEYKVEVASYLVAALSPVMVTA